VQEDVADSREELGEMVPPRFPSGLELEHGTVDRTSKVETVNSNPEVVDPRNDPLAAVQSIDSDGKKRLRTRNQFVADVAPIDQRKNAEQDLAGREGENETDEGAAHLDRDESVIDGWEKARKSWMQGNSPWNETDFTHFLSPLAQLNLELVVKAGDEDAVGAVADVIAGDLRQAALKVPG
jgi:hypothetical protein